MAKVRRCVVARACGGRRRCVRVGRLLSRNKGKVGEDGCEGALVRGGSCGEIGESKGRMGAKDA